MASGFVTDLIPKLLPFHKLGCCVDFVLISCSVRLCSSDTKDTVTEMGGSSKGGGRVPLSMVIVTEPLMMMDSSSDTGKLFFEGEIAAGYTQTVVTVKTPPSLVL